MNPQVNKTLEHSLDFCIALTATLLQIHFQFNMDSIYLKIAIFTGSVTYLFRAIKDEKLSTKDALFTALIGYTFGLYIAPAVCAYFEFKHVSIITSTHYLSGVMGMWTLNVGWNIMKGANKEGWGIVKNWINRKTNNDGSNQSEQN
jgi:hypothetical protein